GGADQDDSTLGAGNSALDEQQAGLGVDGVDREVLRGVLDGTHATGHPHALEDATRGRGPADRARLAVVAVLTVGRTDTGEVVALHDTSGALALGGRGDVDLRARLEHLSGDLLAQLVAGRIRGAQLDQVTARRDAGLLEVARVRLVDLAGIDLAEADLDGGVAVDVLAADLRDDVGRRLHDGDGDEVVVLVPDLGHAQLGAHDALDREIGRAHV